MVTTLTDRAGASTQAFQERRRIADRIFRGALIYKFAVVFALIWGSYLVTDTRAEVGGSLFGRQRLRVWGIGDINHKSIGGTVSGLAGALVFCLWMVIGHGLPAPMR